MGALHHALLIIDEEVGAAGQDRPALLGARLGWTLSAKVCYEAVNQFAQVPAKASEITPHACKITHRDKQVRIGAKKGRNQNEQLVGTQMRARYIS